VLPKAAGNIPTPVEAAKLLAERRHKEEEYLFLKAQAQERKDKLDRKQYLRENKPGILGRKNRNKFDGLGPADGMGLGMGAGKQEYGSPESPRSGLKSPAAKARQRRAMERRIEQRKINDALDEEKRKQYEDYLDEHELESLPDEDYDNLLLWPDLEPDEEKQRSDYLAGQAWRREQAQRKRPLLDDEEVISERDSVEARSPIRDDGTRRKRKKMINDDGDEMGLVPTLYREKEIRYGNQFEGREKNKKRREEKSKFRLELQQDGAKIEDEWASDQSSWTNSSDEGEGMLYNGLGGGAKRGDPRKMKQTEEFPSSKRDTNVEYIVPNLKRESKQKLYYQGKRLRETDGMRARQFGKSEFEEDKNRRILYYPDEESTKGTSRGSKTSSAATNLNNLSDKRSSSKGILKTHSNTNSKIQKSKSRGNSRSRSRTPSKQRATLNAKFKEDDIDDENPRRDDLDRLTPEDFGTDGEILRRKTTKFEERSYEDCERTVESSKLGTRSLYNAKHKLYFGGKANQKRVNSSNNRFIPSNCGPEESPPKPRSPVKSTLPPPPLNLSSMIRQSKHSPERTRSRSRSSHTKEFEPPSRIDVEVQRQRQNLSLERRRERSSSLNASTRHNLLNRRDPHHDVMIKSPSAIAGPEIDDLFAVDIDPDLCLHGPQGGFPRPDGGILRGGPRMNGGAYLKRAVGSDRRGTHNIYRVGPGGRKTVRGWIGTE